MEAVLFPHRTPELDAWLEDRRSRGLDIRDEVWEGVYVVMTPAPGERHGLVGVRLASLLLPVAEDRGLNVLDAGNVGDPEDYRIPDVIVYRRADVDPSGTWLSTAEVAVEIRSPGEAHDEKLPFYASRGVDEVVLVDPDARTLRWLALADGAYTPVERSEVLGVDVQTAIVDRLRWD